VRSQNGREAQVVPSLSPYEEAVHQRSEEEDKYEANIVEEETEGEEVMQGKKNSIMKKACTVVMARPATTRKKPSTMQTKKA
tara:strand:- start:219 stop:464 length:246 start_codon:yes stop_codon:yes gene_type:complete